MCTCVSVYVSVCTPYVAFSNAYIPRYSCACDIIVLNLIVLCHFYHRYRNRYNMHSFVHLKNIATTLWTACSLVGRKNTETDRQTDSETDSDIYIYIYT